MLISQCFFNGSNLSSMMVCNLSYQFHITIRLCLNFVAVEHFTELKSTDCFAALEGSTELCLLCFIRFEVHNVLLYIQLLAAMGPCIVPTSCAIRRSRGLYPLFWKDPFLQDFSRSPACVCESVFVWLGLCSCVYMCTCACLFESVCVHLCLYLSLCLGVCVWNVVYVYVQCSKFECQEGSSCFFRSKHRFAYWVHVLMYGY